MLNKIDENNKITINCITGHQGYEGNEIADVLAKQGSLKEMQPNT